MILIYIFGGAIGLFIGALGLIHLHNLNTPGPKLSDDE